MAPTVCMPTKFAALCARLTKQQLSRVKDIGLECLVDKGEKVEISSKKADTTLFNMYKGRGDTAITLKHLEARIGNGYNWAEFTLEFLINHVELFKKKKRTGLVGNLAFLQIWFFEHVQVANDCFDYALHERPLIGNWDGNKVVKRAQLEGVKKIGFAKVIYHLQGDSAKEVTLSDNVEDVYEESHIMKGSYKAESICDNGKFENILHRIDMLEKETKQQYQSLVRRIEVIEEQTRCLPELVRVMQRVVSFIDRSSGHKSSGVLNEEISEGNIEKEDRPKRDSVKRKLELVKSPTLVEKVKTRRDRQPSKIITSPYEMMKQRKIYEKNVEEVQFDVSRYEQAAIVYVKKELARSSDKMLVRIDAVALFCSHMRCLVEPGWLDSELISSYTIMFNHNWEKEGKHEKYAFSTYQSDWLRSVGKDWISSHDYSARVGPFSQITYHNIVSSEMVFIPMNTTNSHWWLCVLRPDKREIQILDPLKRHMNYKDEIKDLRCGIHSFMEAVRNCPTGVEVECRWDYKDILVWNVKM
ncbi:hypothetical protein GUJ93_ZPchr0152g29220 [Zizania palustris]|uniref:Ubiquitin-like protease family profile domain-containing protein n=1 Tax=Zizania palustris TaxID=103762 RepID=A0A8J5RTG1_ZIZPA|nr:hypothetical protein GUJ93_ZPchr0152g29220 [Zizania palustris]